MKIFLDTNIFIRFFVPEDEETHAVVRSQDCLEKIVALRNMVIVDTSDSKKALAMRKKTGVKFTDCLIATQVPKGVILVTYDRDFAKLPRLTVRTPQEMLAEGTRR